MAPFFAATDITPSNAMDIKTNLAPLLESLGLCGQYHVSIGGASLQGRAIGNADVFSSIEDMRELEASVIQDS